MDRARRETTTYARRGYADRASTRDIDFTFTGAGRSPAVFDMAFSARHETGPVTKTYTEPTATYNLQPSTTTISCGPFIFLASSPRDRQAKTVPRGADAPFAGGT